MELKLNIYEKRRIVKTYTADTYDIMFGTLEDIIGAVDVEKLQGSAGDTEFIAAVAKIITQGFGVFKPLLKDIFDGLTDEELRNTRVKDVVPVIMGVLQYAFSEMTNMGNAKN